MTADEIKGMYRRTLLQPITVRRYTGAGANRPRFDVTVNGNAKMYGAAELVGSIMQGDQRVIVLAEDLIAAQFSLPITTADKVVIDGKELAIVAPPGSRDALDGTAIAFELQTRG
jgi:hypothetical protein